MKNWLKKLFNSFGYELSNLETFKRHRTTQFECQNGLNRLSYLISKVSILDSENFGIPGFVNQSISKVLISKSQIFQDLFVLYCLKEKRNGFFVEFGATDGISLSNTFLLEKEFGWQGILAEPAKLWKLKLHENRKCHIEEKCIWSKSGENLTFNEASIGELSTINLFVNCDTHAEKRKEIKEYIVETISLNDLLIKFNAPHNLDYLSIDTEGSEIEILESFDFSKYIFSVVTIEHNYTKNREKIYDLMLANGYVRVFESISLFDDWYVHDSIIQSY